MSIYVPAGFAQNVLSFSLSGSTKRFAVTLGVDHPNTADAAAVSSGVYAAWTGSGKPLFAAYMASGWVFEGVDTFMGPIGGPEWNGQAGPQGAYKVPIVGTQANAPAPVNCAVLIRKNTAFGGRRYRGRMFMPPFSFAEGSINALGVIDAAGVAAYQTQMNTVHAALTTAGMLPVLFHHDEDPWYAPTSITSFGVQSLLSTQRRRMR